MSEEPIRAADCEMERQGRPGGSCEVETDGSSKPACEATLRTKEGKLERLVRSAHLSRPENYLSIYQSGCNFSCKKCHSWEFSQKATGGWFSAEALVEACRQYEGTVTLIEPREKATSWHAQESCRCCGSCVVVGKRSDMCPEVLSPDQITLSPQGFGPSRNIVGFTGGDLTCRPEFYEEFARRVKGETKLWVLIETNGWGLTPANLDRLQEAGVDAFWLDIKAFDDEPHKWVTGCTNQWILDLPAEMRRRGFVLEVLSLYIPDMVETDQLKRIAAKIAAAGEETPFTILAFFPEYRMADYRPPVIDEMVAAYEAARAEGLRNVRMGNLAVFVRTESDLQRVFEATKGA